MTKKRLPLAIALTSIFIAAAVVLAWVFVPGILGESKSPAPKPTETTKPAPVVNELERIFDPSKVSQTFIELPPASIKKLSSYNNEKYVAAKFRMIYDGTETQSVNVGIRIKGSTTHSTLNNLYYRPSFKIKFDWAKGYETQTLFGKRS
ncbi:MAG: hypothetical protein RJA45_75, partial [Actinomycetota bacterium]